MGIEDFFMIAQTMHEEWGSKQEIIDSLRRDLENFPASRYSKVWTTQERNKIVVADIKMGHLCNIINYLKKLESTDYTKNLISFLEMEKEYRLNNFHDKLT